MFAVPDLLRRVRLGACASAAAALAVAGLVTGCSDLTEVLSLDPGGVSPTSPVARQAVAAVPTGLAPAADIKSSVVRLMGDRRSLNDLIFALPPAPTDTDRFLAGSRDVLNARALTPPPENQPALTEAFASETRTAIQPPPAPKEPAPRR